VTRRLTLPDAQIVARYDAGEPVLQIAQAYGVSTPVIYTRLREHGRSIRRPRLSPEGRVRVLALYESGLSSVAAARKMGISRSTVRKVVAQAGLTRPTPEEQATAEARTDTVQEIARRRRAGESVRALSQEYGIPRATLTRRLARAQDRSEDHA